MQKSILKLEASNDASAYRAIIKTRHGRTIFLSLAVNGSICTITDCFYTDRNQGRARSGTLQFQTEKATDASIPHREPTGSNRGRAGQEVLRRGVHRDRAG